MIAQKSFFTFINNCSELIDILEKKAGVTGFNALKSYLNILKSNKINLITFNYEQLLHLIESSLNSKKMTDSKIHQLVFETRQAIYKTRYYAKRLEIKGHKKCFYLHSDMLKQFYDQTLSEIFNDMNSVCAQYLTKCTEFKKKSFTDSSWEAELEELNELYKKTKKQMHKTFSQTLERLKSKELKIEARQRASLCPNIVGLQRMIGMSKPKKLIPKRAHLINNGRQMINQINELIYRIGNFNAGLGLTTNTEAVKTTIDDFNQLVINSASEKDIKASLKKLKDIKMSLQKDFEQIEEKRIQTNEKVNEAIQKRREYEVKQKDKVLENKKLDKLFSNTDSKKGNYTNAILSDETKPYLNQLNKLQREFGYSHPEYQAVARQFLEHITTSLNKKDSRLLMSQLKKANIVLKSANRIEIPSFLLNPEIFSQGSNSRTR